MQHPSFGLIIVGDEILSGKRQDAHFAKVREMLQQVGLSLAWVHYAGDDREALVRLYRQAAGSGDIVFSCGGIGATPDDHTRQAVAMALGEPLVLHPEAKPLILSRVKALCESRGEPFDPDSAETRGRLEMGEFPAGAEIIPNPFNQIPGFSVGDLHCVPGFPVMAHPMIESLIHGRYAHLHRQSSWVERSFILPGAIEGQLTPLMQAVEARFPELKIFSLPSVDHPQWGRHVELGVKHPGGDWGLVDQGMAMIREDLHARGQVIALEMRRPDAP